MLLYDADNSEWIDNVMSGDATMADTGVITISNDAVTLDKIADAVIITESEGISGNDVDTGFPTAAAVKDYVDSQLGRHGGIFRTDSSDNALGANVQYNRDVIFDSSNVTVSPILNLFCVR